MNDIFESYIFSQLRAGPGFKGYNNSTCQQHMQHLQHIYCIVPAAAFAAKYPTATSLTATAFVNNACSIYSILYLVPAAAFAADYPTATSLTATAPQNTASPASA